MKGEANVRPICLDHLSLSDLTALELIEVASSLGCAAVSLFVTPLPLGPYRDLVNDVVARREVLSALRDTGLSVGIVEPFMLDEAIDWDLLRRTAALTAELGGTVNTLCFDKDRARLEGSVARLAEISRAEGASMAIEPFTLSKVRTIAEALQLADLAGDDIGLTIDTLHVIRTGGSWADVAAVPPQRIFHVQLDDGPMTAPDDLYLEATLERLPPGHGEFDLASLIPLVPQTARIAVEAPFRPPAGATPLERARTLIDATSKLLN
jgi:sugar phosphate isomerase/epimerase